MIDEILIQLGLGIATRIGVIIGMTYMFMPLINLPRVTVMSGIDPGRSLSCGPMVKPLPTHPYRVHGSLCGRGMPSA